MNKVKELNKISEKITGADSGFVFLQFLDKYLEVIDSDPMLSKALDLLQKYHQEESVDLATEQWGQVPFLSALLSGGTR